MPRILDCLEGMSAEQREVSHSPSVIDRGAVVCSESHQLWLFSNAEIRLVRTSQQAEVQGTASRTTVTCRQPHEDLELGALSHSWLPENLLGSVSHPEHQSHLDLTRR